MRGTPLPWIYEGGGVMRSPSGPFAQRADDEFTRGSKYLLVAYVEPKEGPRSVPEWIGRTPDADPPPRVKLRVRDRARSGDGRLRCQSCTRTIAEGEPAAIDHVVALVNGGENRESNLRLVCLKPCHRAKTKRDVTQKASAARKRRKLLLSKRKTRFRGWRN